jgi:hypothetical protein
MAWRDTAYLGRLSHRSMVLERRSRSSSVLQRKLWKRSSCVFRKWPSVGRVVFPFFATGLFFFHEL